MHGLLKDHGFEPLASDSAVYVNLKKRTFIITFVDNCLMIGPDKHYISALKAKVGKTYAIEDRGPASYFLGVEIVRDRPNRRLYITQRNYISKVLKHFNYNTAAPIRIPLQPGLIKNVNANFTALKSTPLSSLNIKLY